MELLGRQVVHVHNYALAVCTCGSQEPLSGAIGRRVWWGGLRGAGRGGAGGGFVLHARAVCKLLGTAGMPVSVRAVCMCGWCELQTLGISVSCGRFCMLAGTPGYWGTRGYWGRQPQ